MTSPNCEFYCIINYSPELSCTKNLASSAANTFFTTVSQIAIGLLTLIIIRQVKIDEKTTNVRLHCEWERDVRRVILPFYERFRLHTQQRSSLAANLLELLDQ